MQPLRVLVVDDEKNIRTTLSVCLESAGCEVTAVATGAAALERLARAAYHLAFVDLRLAGESGLDLLPQLLAESPELAVVIVTAYASFDSAVEAVKRGAWDYLPKPFTPAQVRHVVDRLAERRLLTGRLAALEEELSATEPARLESTAPAMRPLLEALPRAARSDAAILVRGEHGTGKGVLARALHRESPRARGPFVTVNCPTLTESLLASELFGHARGAFTGAVRDQPGRVEAAEGGTLFLDEIGEVPLALQAKLLRFIQDHEFERVGESRTRRADVRIVAATNRDLEADVAAGRFREDLLFRLNVVELRLPPLRERPEDILPLARLFLARFTRARAGGGELSPAAEELLVRQPWPGNVRELQNAIERAVILWPARRLEPGAFADRMAAAAGPHVELGGEHTLEAVEREHILRVLARAPSLEAAAASLGIDSSTLWRKRKKYEEG
jgi:NtrC-family two-component system response regulator AlgB